MLNISDITSAADARYGFGLGACPALAAVTAKPASAGSTAMSDGIGSAAMSDGSGAMAHLGTQYHVMQWAGIAADKGRPATYAGAANIQNPTKQHSARVTRTAVIGGTLGSHPAREPV